MLKTAGFGGIQLPPHRSGWLTLWSLLGGGPLLRSMALIFLNKRTAREPLSLFHGLAVNHANVLRVPAATPIGKDFHYQVSARLNSGLADERDPLDGDIRHVRIHDLLA